MRRTSAIVLLALCVSGSAFAESDDDLRDWDEPWAIVKVGVGLPGVPSLAAELFLRESLTMQAEGGNGPIGAYGALSVRYRPCFGCTSGGPAFAIGAGPELLVIPSGEDERTAVIPALIVEPAVSWRFLPHLGVVLGIKGGFGWDFDWKNGAYYGSEPAILFGINLGVQF